MTVVAGAVLDGLGEDHLSWLLVAAHNDLRQRRAERATALLELLDALDPDNLQCHKMLVYAYLLQGDLPRCAALADALLDRPLDAADRAAVELMRRRLEGNGGAAPAAGEPGGGPPA